MLKEIKKMLTFNLKTLFIFEFIYKLSSIFLFVPLFWKIFNSIMNVRRYRYLTLENIGSFLFHPLTLLLLLFLVLLLVVYSIFDIFTVLVIFDASKNEQKISIREALVLAFPKSLKVFSIKNFSFAVFVFFFLFFFNLGLTTSFLTSVEVPEFIMDFIYSQWIYKILFIFMLFIILFYVLRNIYVPHYFLLEEENLKQASVKSHILSKPHATFDFLCLIFTEVFLFLSYLVILYVLIFVLYWIHSFFENVFVESIFLTGISFLILIVFSFYFFISMPFCMAVLSVLFYRHKEELQEIRKPLVFSSKNREEPILRRWHFFKLIGGLFLFVSGTFFTYEAIQGKYDFTEVYLKKIEVTAHRGASKECPENTMSAFKKAYLEGADVIELDVRLTKDKEIVVVHDASLKRILGITKNVNQVEFDEIKEQTVLQSENIEDNKIPKLKDVLNWAVEHHVRLNIELKANKEYEELVHKVISLVKEKDYFSNIVLASSNYEILKLIKQYDKNITTVFVTSLLYGNIEDLKETDIFSVSEVNVTKSLVSQVHEAGKQIYVWTVNGQENMNKMKELEVDNLITDDVLLGKKVLEIPSKKNLLTDYIKLVESLIK